MDSSSSGSPETVERDLYTAPNGQDRWLTPDEALAEGFCPLCGAFVAGNEWDDLHIGQYGACAECVAEIEADQQGDDFEDF